MTINALICSAFSCIGSQFLTFSNSSRVCLYCTLQYYLASLPLSLARRARSTHKQLALQNHLTSRTRRVRDALQQQLGRRFADLVRRLGNQRDRGLHQRCPCCLVEGDQRTIIGGGKVALANRLQTARCEQAVRCEEGVRQPRCVDHFQGGCVTCFDPRLYIFHMLRRYREVVFAQRLFIACVPVAPGRAHLTEDEGDVSI